MNQTVWEERLIIFWFGEPPCRVWCSCISFRRQGQWADLVRQVIYENQIFHDKTLWKFSFSFAPSTCCTDSNDKHSSLSFVFLVQAHCMSFYIPHAVNIPLRSGCTVHRFSKWSSNMCSCKWFFSSHWFLISSAFISLFTHTFTPSLSPSLISLNISWVPTMYKAPG